ncbi:MAG: PQ-loop domain-containing transporter [Gammaproteobacteria bacterium]|nr:PQ-loop domain-containing transporter [Gammaproteobacteria bacterium]
MVIGQITLNLSLLIYTVLYLPQVVHNQKQTNLDGLSKWMHVLLYFSYSLDLVYGFAADLPWQYRLVSGTGWLLLTIQHIQLTYHFKLKKKQTAEQGYYSLLIIVFVALIYCIGQESLSLTIINLMGYTAQTGFVIAIIPQIIKSKQLKSAQAINITYILFNLVLSFLDLVSAWKLEWGWPNKAGSAAIFVLMSILLIQHRQYYADKYSLV